MLTEGWKFQKPGCGLSRLANAVTVDYNDETQDIFKMLESNLFEHEASQHTDWVTVIADPRVSGIACFVIGGNVNFVNIHKQ